MKFMWSVTVLLALGVAFVACGGDDDDDMGAAGASGAGAGGFGGSSGVGGSTGGTGGTTMTMTGVPCGATTCMSSLMLPGGIPGGGGAIPGGGMLGGLLPQPCCMDAATSKCGQMMNGGACMPPPPPPMTDTRCPSLMVPVVGSMPGCCINEMCGVNASLLGMGCIENGQAAMNLGGSPIPIMIPPPRRCDAPPDEDAGVAMTGGGDDAGI